MKHLSLIACSIAILAPGPVWAQTSARTSDAVALHLNGLEHGYNLDYPEALATFQEAIAADPHDGTAHRLAAATLWMRLLFEQGAMTVDDYLGQVRAHVTRKTPAADRVAAFHDHLQRATTLAEQKLRDNPVDADAHFQIGAAAALRASYTATIEGRVRDSIGVARRAYHAHVRCLMLDPRRRDAALIVGTYRYAVTSLPFPLRIMARLSGFGGSSRDVDLRLVEDAAQYASYAQTHARFVLVLLYNREGRHDDALRIIHRLERRYPRNRLLWLEEGSTALRAGRAAEALLAIDKGLAQLASDPRPRAYGEEARWRYQRGAALVALRATEAAGRELSAVLAVDAPAWLRGRTHLELGKLADLAGDRARAAAEYRLATHVCRAEHDSACFDEAKRRVGSPPWR